MMKFGSVCSGIEAASVAWHPLGSRPAWLAEIEPFPAAVLAHHYPDVPNLGDMTRLPERIRSGEVAAPDVFCGGTPCQAFSIAGLRRSLDDARGNLSLVFCEIADAIDSVRLSAGDEPAIIVWENVPGVLSTSDNAFGCFLAGLAGEDEPLVAPGGKWSNAGYVLGPKRAVAWRVLDAQYFGVAQRRRRVFVVASARNGFDPAAVLFEWDGVRRDSAPSREAGETTSHAIAPSLTCSGRGFDRVGETRGQDPVVAIMAHGQGGAEIARERSPTLTCNHEAPIVTLHVVHGTQDPCVSQLQQPQAGRPCHPLAAGAVLQPAIAGTLGANHGNIKAEHAWTGQLLPVPAYAIQAGALRTNPNSGPDGIGVQEDHAYTLEARAEVQAVCVSLRGREGGATAELGDEVGNCLRASGGGGDKAYVLASVADTLCNKGFNTLKEGNASTQETYPGTLLRTLRKEVGEEAFAKWGLGILDSLQQAEVLRQALYGLSIRPATFPRSWVVCCALGFTVYGSGWLLQSLREAGCERCSPQGWEPSEQFSRELGAYLSELSQPGAQAARFMRDLWFASEGFGLLQQALLAVQEVGRPANRQGKPVFRNAEGVGAKAGKSLLSSGVQRETSCERVLQQTRSTSKARDARGASEDEGGSGFGQMASGMMVRRLTVEECEFLQGFPRGYTAIPWRKKPSEDFPDGPRYKAIGNSMAVPVIAWIGQRINNQIENPENGQTEP